MFGRSDKRDKDLDRELGDHLELDAEAHQDAGLSADEARFAARRDFGNITRVKEVTREMWGWAWLERLWQDVRFGLRTLRKSPGFTAVAILVLSLGIGVNATVFTIANAMLYKDLPFADSDRILYVSGLNRADGSVFGASYPDFRDFRSQVKSLESLGAMVQGTADISDDASAPRLYSSLDMSANGFSVIGQKPFSGRDFVPEDERPGAVPVAILSYGLWETRYGSDPGIIGKSVRINQKPTIVVGVMPPGMQFRGVTDVWLPLVPAGIYEKREVRDLNLFGKMAQGATLKSARAEMDSIARRLSAEYPATNKDIGARVEHFVDFFTGGKNRGPLMTMLGAVAFVLLIACANVASLLLARAVVRSREISIRSALGASRWRVIRQLLIESMILSIAGGGLGWLAGLWGVRLFDATMTANGGKPPYLTFSADYTVLAYMAAITLGTGVLFGLAPALRLSRLDINPALKDGGHGTSGGRRGKYLSAALVIAEMSLAVVLLAGAGLLMRSFLNLVQSPIGVRSDHVLTMRMYPGAKYPRLSDKIRFYDRLQEQLRALPSVDSVAIASNLPARVPLNFKYELEGAFPVDAQRRSQTDTMIISPAYFQVMGVQQRAGRTFTEADAAVGYPVVIVNESFAAASWPQESSLGKRLRLVTEPPDAPIGTPEMPQEWLTVVGVVPDILQDTHTIPDPLIYVLYRQQLAQGMNVVARTNVPPGNLAEPFRQAVHGLDKDLSLTYLLSLDESLARTTWSSQFFATMFAIFGAIALSLASVGLYAVIAHSVSQRTQEIGVRITMGATGWNILRLVFSQGMGQLGIGLAVGFAGAFGVTRMLNHMLVDVKPWDPVTLVSVALVLMLAGALGCMIPARRAIRVDPVVTLRHD